MKIVLLELVRGGGEASVAQFITGIEQSRLNRVCYSSFLAYSLLPRDLFIQNLFCEFKVIEWKYSRTLVARTLMARSPWLFRPRAGDHRKNIS